MPSTFTYSKINDFSAAVNISTLSAEISKSAITIALDHIGTSGDVCTVFFKAELPSADETILAAVIAAHTGASLQEPPQLVRLDAPTDPGNKPIVSISPATIGLKTWLTGAGDGPDAASRGLGTPILVEFDGTESFPFEKETLYTFNEPIEIHDGQLVWGPVGAWGHQDRFSLSIIIPAVVATPNAGFGNVNAVSLGGGAVVYVPAAGDGSHDVDLSVASPSPASVEGTGYWDVDQLTGVITPAANPGAGDFNLLNFQLEPYFIANIGMGHRYGVFDVDVYRCSWVHTSWVMRLSVSKVTPVAGDMSGWVLAFRPSNVRI